MLKMSWKRIFLGTMAVLALGLGVTAALAQSPKAERPTGLSLTQVADRALAQVADGTMLPVHWGVRGGPGMAGEADTYLAEALGITVEELQAAYEEARAAAIEQAVADGLITQEQADAILSGERPGRFGFGRGFGHGMGLLGQGESFLADALGISVEELEAAKETARNARLEQAVADGTITEEQAGLILARQALKDYIDREAIVAEALGISVEELEAARADGQRLPELIEELGLDMTVVREALTAAHEDAVQQAVADGVITQAQADQILSGEGFGFGSGRCGGHRGHGRGGPGGFGGIRGPNGNGPFGGTSDA